MLDDTGLHVLAASLLRAPARQATQRALDQGTSLTSRRPWHARAVNVDSISIYPQDVAYNVLETEGPEIFRKYFQNFRTFFRAFKLYEVDDILWRPCFLSNSI